ncbi:MAG TPA: toast rack family protein [Thermomicrobiales bacterium]|nr:toast rack family protein [Thermomicrobiales bacterium]
MGLFDKLTGAEHKEERSIARDGVTSGRVRVDMAVGELVITGGASDLMNGVFAYDTELEPQIDFQARDGVGELSIVQARGQRAVKWKLNRWEIALNDEIPLDLELRMATGKLDARLSTLRLRSVRIDHTTGELVIGLGGNQLELRAVSIKQSTGRTRLDLSGNYAALRALKLSATTGEAELNLAGGAWGQDLDARVDVTTGSTSILLPHDVGVEVSARSALGKVSASGLSYDNGHYRNAAHGTTPSTLRLDVRTSVGKLSLKVAG